MKAETHSRKVDIRDNAGQVVGSKEVVLYAGLLSQAHDEGLARVRTSMIQIPTAENGRLAIVKAEIETGKGLFEAIGDACPESVEPHLAPHLIRVAETRAKARALRDAVNIGVVSYEELDGVTLAPGSPGPGSGAPPATRRAPSRTGNGAAPRSSPPRAARTSNGQDGPMSEAQRRYLFRILAGMGYQGQAAEDYLHAELSVRALNQVTRTQASELIEQLLQSPAPAAGAGGGSARPQR